MTSTLPKLIAAIALLSTSIASAQTNDLTIPTDATTVVVSPAQMGRWVIRATNTGEAKFVKGPTGVPRGEGSLQLTTGSGDGPDKGGKIWFGTSDYDGLMLSKITAIMYSAYIESAVNAGVAPYMNIHIDTNDNGKWDGRKGGDDILSFDPTTQPQPVGNVPMKPGIWATGVGGTMLHGVRADMGSWWIVGKEDIAGRNGKEKTLAQIVQLIGDHKIIANTGENVPGLSFIAGAGSGGSFANFVGNIDQIMVGANGVNTIYDLEWSEPRVIESPIAAQGTPESPQPPTAVPAIPPVSGPMIPWVSTKFGMRFTLLGVLVVVLVVAFVLRSVLMKFHDQD